MEEWIGGAIQRLRSMLKNGLDEQFKSLDPCSFVLWVRIIMPHIRRYQWLKLKDANNKKTKDEEENRAPAVHMMHYQSTTFIRDRTFLKLTNPQTIFLGPIGSLLD